MAGLKARDASMIDVYLMGKCMDAPHAGNNFSGGNSNKSKDQIVKSKFLNAGSCSKLPKVTLVPASLPFLNENPLGECTKKLSMGEYRKKAEGLKCYG